MFNLKSLLDIEYYKSVCNVSYLILILVLIFFITFAIKTHKRYIKVKDLIGDYDNKVAEGFQNIQEDDKEQILKDLNIDKNDIDIVKRNNREKLSGKGDTAVKEDKVEKPDTMIITPSKIITISPDKIYDKFYADVYDTVALDKPKVTFEAGYIKSLIDLDRGDNKILDVGCGTGQHTKYLSEHTEYVGLDKSNDMLRHARMNINNNCRLVAGDANKLSVVAEDAFSHIICLYFTIYYFKDPDKLFYNFGRWLKKDGILVIHLVDRDKFDPVLNPANPSRVNSIQKYADKRITSSIINFNNVTYISDFVLKKNNMAEFQEIIRFKKTNTERRQRHIMYMFTNKKYVQIAKKNGFELQEIKSMNEVKYEHNYLFVFKKKE
jgi:ubiquinone/menaquinone biosynthesis C-methylase UbiE